MDTMFVDSHIHLTHNLFDGSSVPCVVSLEDGRCLEHCDRETLISKMKTAGITCFVEPGIDLESNYAILEITKHHPEIHPAIGLHPTRVINEKWRNRKKLESLAMTDGVVAIGETGLDYHKNPSLYEKWWQKRWFIWQIRLAYRLHLPLILHIRSASEDAIKILRRRRKYISGGVCHCFNSSVDVARIYTEEFGFMLGIGGSLLQENAAELENTVREIPLEYILLETDGPFVKPAKPEGVTGKQWQKARNTSLILKDVAGRIATIKGIDVETVKRVTTENAFRLFSLKEDL